MNTMNIKWYVLYVQTGKELLLCERLNRQKEFTAIFPQWEYYRRDKDEVWIKGLFPGYVFVKTTCCQSEFESKLYSMEIKDKVYRNLKYESMEEEPVSALRPEEIQLLNYLLDEEGILRMSYGHLVGNRLKIDSGPLVPFEDYITKYDKRNRMATLSLFFIDQVVKAGVTIPQQEEN